MGPERPTPERVLKVDSAATVVEHVRIVQGLHLIRYESVHEGAFERLFEDEPGPASIRARPTYHMTQFAAHAQRVGLVPSHSRRNTEPACSSERDSDDFDYETSRAALRKRGPLGRFWDAKAS